MRRPPSSRAAHPDVAIVGSGYSYLQQWLPNAAQHTVRTGGATSVGIGRGMLSYPQLPADVLAGRTLHTSLLCRTFSDCTTAPRNGLVSGCYPLDELYKNRPERIELAALKKATRHRTRGGKQTGLSAPAVLRSERGESER